MSFFKKVCDYHDRRQKQVLNKESSMDKLRWWVWYNSPYLLLTGVIVAWIILILMLLQCGGCVESGKPYNHLKDCASIIGGVLCEAII